jgi:hypothetical protein
MKARSRGLRFSLHHVNALSPILAQFRHRRSRHRQVVLFIEGIRRPEPPCMPPAHSPWQADPRDQDRRTAQCGGPRSPIPAIAPPISPLRTLRHRQLPLADDLVEAASFAVGGCRRAAHRFAQRRGTVDLLYDYAEAEGAAMPDHRRDQAALLP